MLLSQLTNDSTSVVLVVTTTAKFESPVDAAAL